VQVCDAPVKDCTDWAGHCKATFGSPAWRAARERVKKGLPADAPGASHPKKSTGTAASSQPSSSLARSRLAGFGYTCEAILKELEQVFPDEAEVPPGLVVRVPDVADFPIIYRITIN
jgi:hypothetical protein